MPNTNNVIINADDFGYSATVNKAIGYCYKAGLINSASIMTNTNGTDEAIELLHTELKNLKVGIHINLIEGKPLTNFTAKKFLDDMGHWNSEKIKRWNIVLSKRERKIFEAEIDAQVNRAKDCGIQLSHINSHCHIHTFPFFLPIFIKIAKKYNLKIRLAQTSRENSYFKYYYRYCINMILAKMQLNFSEYFETVDSYNVKKHKIKSKVTEIMTHPDIDGNNCFVDSLEKKEFRSFIESIN